MKLKKLRSSVLRQIVAASDAEAQSSSTKRVQGLGPVLKASLPSALLSEYKEQFEVRLSVLFVWHLSAACDSRGE